jgi:hypothetical protein
MWQLLAIVLGAILLFYWLAFMGTIWFWFNALFALTKGHFIRAAIWACLGFGMLAWWQGTEVIPHPWDVDAWLRGSAVIVGLGALGTFARFYNRHRQAVQAVPPFEPTPVVLNINIELSTNPHADRHAVHDDLAAIASALRGAIAQNKGLGGYPVRLSSTNENNPPGKAKTAMTQFGRQPVLGFNEQIFGADEQVPIPTAG